MCIEYTLYRFSPVSRVFISNTQPSISASGTGLLSGIGLAKAKLLRAVMQRMMYLDCILESLLSEIDVSLKLIMILVKGVPKQYAHLLSFILCPGLETCLIAIKATRLVRLQADLSGQSLS